jgi:hypothetical protein
MHEFPSPKDRIRTILEQALRDTTYVSSTSEDGGSRLHLRANRSDGRRVNVRFRGVRESESTAEPEPGAPLSLQGVGNADKLFFLRGLTSLFKPPPPPGARVRIDAGAARLEIVCQDAEWWEE